MVHLSQSSFVHKYDLEHEYMYTFNVVVFSQGKQKKDKRNMTQI